MMQDIGRRYVRVINMINPVRAGMVGHPAQYPWSSHGHYGSARPNGLITEHPEYQRLGPDDDARRTAFRSLCADPLPERVVEIGKIHAVRRRAARPVGACTHARTPGESCYGKIALTPLFAECAVHARQHLFGHQLHRAPHRGGVGPIVAAIEQRAEGPDVLAKGEQLVDDLVHRA